ncbi:MAG: BlaI/MecI/CopY family transcriptional regulator [Candidatus Thorarchaeota archaeon]
MKIVKENESYEAFVKIQVGDATTAVKIQIFGLDLKEAILVVNGINLGEMDITKSDVVAYAVDRVQKDLGVNKDDLKDLLTTIVKKIEKGQFDVRHKKKEEMHPSSLHVLQDPKLIQRLYEVETRSVENEMVEAERDSILVNLTIASSMCDVPNTLMFTGPSGVGKTVVAVHCASAWPESVVIDVAGSTAKAFRYASNVVTEDEDGNPQKIVNLNRQCLLFYETSENKDAILAFKPMMSRDRNKLEYLIADKVDGKRQMVKHIFMGTPSFILLGTEQILEEEIQTRTLKASPESNEQKTKKIIKSIFQQDLVVGSKLHPELDLIRKSLEHLEQIKTINPFALVLEKIFPTEESRFARSAHKLRSLIFGSVVLHQFQRPYVIHEGEKYYVATLEDNLLGVVMFNEYYRSELYGLAPDVLKVIEVIREPSLSTDGFTAQDLHQRLLGDRNLTLSSVKYYLKNLQEKGIVSVEQKKKETFYRPVKFMLLKYVPRDFVMEFLAMLKMNIDVVVSYIDKLELKGGTKPLVKSPFGHDEIFGLNYFGSNSPFMRKVTNDKKELFEVHPLATITYKPLEDKRKREVAEKKLKEGLHEFGTKKIEEAAEFTQDLERLEEMISEWEEEQRLAVEFGMEPEQAKKFEKMIRNKWEQDFK